MTWKPPESEEAWLECLSAYLDGEMEPDAERAIERVLEIDPRRAEQFRALQHTSHLLQEWDVEAPEPIPAFERQSRQILGESRRSTFQNLYEQFFSFPSFRWGFQAAVFLLGVLTGVFGTSLFQHATSSPGRTARQTYPTAVHVFVSPNQAENLLREVAATHLVDQIQQEVRERNWRDAHSLCQALIDNHSDTSTAREFQQAKGFRRLKDMYPKLGRI